MTDLTTILCVSASNADKVIAEKCAYFLNSESAFCHCICPAEVTFRENETLVTVKTEPLNEAIKDHQSDAPLKFLDAATMGFLAGYKAS